MSLFRGYGIKGLGRFGTITKVLIKHGLGDIVERLFQRKKAYPRQPSEKEPLARRGFPSPRRIRLYSRGSSGSSSIGGRSAEMC